VTDQQETRQPDVTVDGAGNKPAPERPLEAPSAEQPAPDTPVEEQESAEERAAERVEEDLDELRTRAAQRDEYLALAQRTQADFENYRKRMAREAATARERGMRQVVEELLPALDNFERALAAAEAEEGDEDHHLTQGIRLVQQDLVAALGRVGIEPFSPKGEAFDPNQHEAISQQPVEGAESGTVVEVYQQGYRLAGNVIRPARVVVAA
jgi:molecular chaperone GrpE